MGIRHLFTFISKNVDNGLYPVDMINLVQSYKRQKPRCTPTIIIDLMMAHAHVYMNDHEILLGGRYAVYNERAHFMFSQLKSMGVNLIFFVDGPSQEDKMETCLKRRNETYENGVRILHAIDDGLDISGDLSGFKLVNLTTFIQNMIDIAQNYGEVFLSTLNECDQEIAYMASRQDVLAVITDDTDFLIFEGEWHLWSGKEMDFGTLTTLEYNKRALRASLSLSPRQMALFASLGGNDIVMYEQLQDFHRRISYRGNKFRAIADIVRKMGSLPPCLNYFDKNSLANLIFHPADREKGMQALQNSMHFYCLVGMQFKQKNYLLDRVAQDLTRFNYTILGSNHYIATFIYCDLLKQFFTPYFQITKPLICRIMGVLLQNETQEDVNRTFFAKLNHDTPFEPVNLTPQYPSLKVPPTLDLLYNPLGKNAALDEVRWNLLCFIISQKLNVMILKQIPRENLGNVLTLFYLVEIKEISVDEADCVLLSCNVSPKIQKSLDLSEVKKINGRDARLPFMYSRFYNIIYNCISAVGLRDYCTLLEFDGLYFHSLRKWWVTANEKIKSTKLETLRSLRIYSDAFGLLPTSFHN